VKDWEVEPPPTGVSLVMAPLCGFNHSTLNVRVVCERFTVNAPPLGE
jgi:hypothetical protein